MLFKSGLGFKDQFEGSSQGGYSQGKDYAFTPDELRIGSIVFGRLKRAVAGYNKPYDDRRPMLVTGLWRKGDIIEKLEVMKFTHQPAHKEYPSHFELDTTHFFRSGKPQYATLRTEHIYLLDNKNDIFPFDDNLEVMHMDGKLWEEILVRRAGAIIYNPHSEFEGDLDLSLEREGFVFPSIPQSAIRGEQFVPEVDFESFPTKPCDIVPQDLVDEIASFSVRYNERMKQKGCFFFTYPAYEDWPVGLPKVEFPVWRNPLLLRGLEPELP